MINDLEIRTAANDAAYQRGWKYYETGTVHNLKTDGNGHYTAVVHGSSKYEVEVDLTTGDRVDDYNCDCPAFLLYDGACKHIVAVLKKQISSKCPYNKQRNIKRGRCAM